MNVLVLGGLGSIVGHNIARNLVRNGFRVSVTGRSSKNKFNLDDKEISIHVGELHNENFVTKVIRDQEIIINAIAAYKPLSAQANFRNSNFELIRNLLDKVQELKMFINLSTISVYGDSTFGTISRAIPHNPKDEYGRNKSELEIYLRQNVRNFSSISIQLPAVLSNPSNDHLIQRFVDILTKNNAIKLYNPNQLFNNVVSINDLIQFIVKLINNNVKANDSFPIASRQPIDLMSIVEKIKKILKSESEIFIIDERRNSYFIDDSYARDKYQYESKSTEKNIEEFLQSYVR